jgi:hypothetical protein
MSPSPAVGKSTRSPKWIKPQLTRLVDEAPAGHGWLHEIKYDGYRMHARINGRDIKLLTRTGLDWSHRYRRRRQDGARARRDRGGCRAARREDHRPRDTLLYVLASTLVDPRSVDLTAHLRENLHS